MQTWIGRSETYASKQKPMIAKLCSKDCAIKKLDHKNSAPVQYQTLRQVSNVYALHMICPKKPFYLDMCALTAYVISLLRSILKRVTQVDATSFIEWLADYSKIKYELKLNSFGSDWHIQLDREIWNNLLFLNLNNSTIIFHYLPTKLFTKQ